MQLAFVKGRATATAKHHTLAGWKLLVCLPLDATHKPGGDALLVIDSLGAGAGDTVLISSDGAGVRERVGDDTTPIRWFTIGIIDPGQLPENN
ncbi:EutN/CcmL family microcompartment protein [Planctomycetales bacterium ZRK34]|nr:EutN/CcmL family microcompartment protein [Planctomycetales bacterium ZRK34]